MAAAADPYTYPGTDVLINKAGIQDQAELNRVEQGLAELGHLKEIHIRLVGDLYDWAGERRTTDVQAMGTGVPHCRPEFLDQFAEQIFSDLARDGNLRDLDQERFSERLAYHWGEVTALHYFRDGNTRSQSAFFNQLSTEAGWAEALAVPSKWTQGLRIIPGEIAVEHPEKTAVDDMEIRLKKSLTGLEAELVIIDCPNRSGGLLLRSALLASDTVLYAADPTEDGVAGVESAIESVERFKQGQADRGLANALRTAGVIVSKYHYGAVERSVEKLSVDDMEKITTVIYPLLPHQPFVLKCRRSGEWYGDYRQGQKISNSYQEILTKVMKND